MSIRLVLIVIFAATSIGAVRRDNFNNNTIGPLWSESEDKIKVDERNGKLKFKSNDSGGGIRESGYVATGWEFDFTRDYTIRFKYRMQPDGVTGSKWVAVGGRIFPNGGDVGVVYVYVRQSSSGLSLVYESESPSGQTLSFQETSIPDSQGQIVARYDKSDDVLRIEANGVLRFLFPNFLGTVDTGNDRAMLDIGAARKGYVQWGWNQVWIDNFKINGTIID